MKLSRKDAADRIGLPVKTLDNWRQLGKGPAFFKLGSRVIYEAADVDAWLSQQRRSLNGGLPPEAA